MITEDQLIRLCAGGRNLHINRAGSALWTVSRTVSNAYYKGQRAQKSSSYSLDLAVEDLLAKAERDLLRATTEGQPA
jgi:hypothetical protein